MPYYKKMSVKKIDLEAGKDIAIFNEKDKRELGVQKLDRVEIFNKLTGKKIAAVVDVTKTMVREKEIGLFKESWLELRIKQGQQVEVAGIPMPESIRFIKKKLDGIPLAENEIRQIVRDIAQNKLDEIEIAALMSGIYTRGMGLDEITSMTKALIENGKKLKLSKTPIVDKHSIGGVNGRSSMIIVPIIASEGLFIPKTSSRSITSSAGTADAMECIARVDLSLKEIKKTVEKTGGCITWGGAVDLAPVDDKIIRIEHPLSLDPEGQVIASVMAKKASVGAQFVVIDLPIGPNVKIKTKEKAEGIAKSFIEVGKQLGIRVECIITDGNVPYGKAFGAALETRHVMQILEGKIFDNLAQKSCELAGVLFELTGKAIKGKGYEKALESLKSKRALQKFREIVLCQGGKIKNSEEIGFGEYSFKLFSNMDGKISLINVRKFSNIARIAGAPADKKAGVLLEIKPGQKIRKGELLFTIFAENRQKLETAKKFAQKNNPIELSATVLKKIE